MNYSRLGNINDFAQYLASEYIANEMGEEMTILEFVEAEVETCDAVTNEVLEESFADMDEAVEYLAEAVEEMVNNQK